MEINYSKKTECKSYQSWKRKAIANGFGNWKKEDRWKEVKRALLSSSFTKKEKKRQGILLKVYKIRKFSFRYQVTNLFPKLYSYEFCRILYNVYCYYLLTFSFICNHFLLKHNHFNSTIKQEKPFFAMNRSYL